MYMKKKKTSAPFEPVKVSLAIACLAAVTLLWLAILGVSS